MSDVRVQVVVPRPPNYLRAPGGGVFDVAQFTEEELRVIGEAWTASLLENAKKRKADATRRADA